MPETLNKSAVCAILKPRNGEARCPYCGALLLRVLPTSVARDLPLRCRRCRRTWMLNTDQNERPESPT